MIVILACLLKLIVQTVTQIQLCGILIVQLHILFISILDLPPNLTDILHDLFRRNHIQHIAERKIHIGNSLRTPGFQKSNQHIEQVIILIQWNFRDAVIGNILRAHKTVFHLACIRIAIGIHNWPRLFKKLIKTGYKQFLIDLFHLVVIQTALSPYIPDQGKNVFSFRIDFCEQQSPVGLCDCFHEFSRPPILWSLLDHRNVMYFQLIAPVLGHDINDIPETDAVLYLLTCDGIPDHDDTF